MKNVQLPSGDNAFSLPQLRARRKELVDAINHIDSVIESIQMLEKTGVLPRVSRESSTPLLDIAHRQKRFADMSIYEATVVMLSEANQPLTTDQIVRSLEVGGKKIEGRSGVATTLYKAVRKKKDCKIVLAGPGKWKLA